MVNTSILIYYVNCSVVSPVIKTLLEQQQNSVILAATKKFTTILPYRRLRVDFNAFLENIEC